MEAAGFSEQEDGLLVPKDHYPTGDFSTLADKDEVEEMRSYYGTAISHEVVAIKSLVDSDNNLLCAVISKGIEGTTYYYERDDKGRPEPYCSPMTIIDLAMAMMGLQKQHHLISWGALTADFRLMYNKGFAPDEWASVAANHVDMLYQLRIVAGSKLNLQLASISMGITPVESEAKSFKVEEAIKEWKTGTHDTRRGILDSMRNYCKLLMALYGAVSEKGGFKYKPKNSGMIENAPVEFPLTWGKVYEIHKDKFMTEIASQPKNSEMFVSADVMHNWLVEHADRNKKSLQQLAQPNHSLTDLMGNNRA